MHQLVSYLWPGYQKRGKFQVRSRKHLVRYEICELICNDNQVFCINLASGLLKLYSSETDGPIWPPFLPKYSGCFRLEPCRTLPPQMVHPLLDGGLVVSDDEKGNPDGPRPPDTPPPNRPDSSAPGPSNSADSSAGGASNGLDVLRLINRTFSSAPDRGAIPFLKGNRSLPSYLMFGKLSKSNPYHSCKLYMFPAFGLIFMINIGVIYHTWIVWAIHFSSSFDPFLQILVG